VTERDPGYGWPHQQDRRRWARRVASGLVLCRRCGNPILVVNGGRARSGCSSTAVREVADAVLRPGRGAPFRRRVPVEVRGRAHYRDVIVPELSGRHVVQGDVTFTEHVDRYLAAHATGRDASTVKTLKHRLGLPPGSRRSSCRG